MAMEIIYQKKGDQDLAKRIPQPFMDLSENPNMMFCLVEGAPGSFDPYVYMVSSDNDGAGVVLIKLSLDQYLFAAAEMLEHAVEHWGWSDLNQRISISKESKKADLKRALEFFVEEVMEKLDELEPKPE